MKDHLDCVIHIACRHIAAGAEPGDRRLGLCHAVEDVFPKWRWTDVRCRLGEIFVSLGLDVVFPLGRGEWLSVDPENPDRWFGDRGVLRRCLARRIARYLEDTGRV